MTISEGTTIAGRFIIKEVLSNRGSRIVCVADDVSPNKRQNNRFVSLKMLNTIAAKDPIQSRRLLDEFLLAKSISHSNVIEVFDYVVEDESALFSMEHIFGETLAKWATQLPRSFSDMLAIFAQISSALQAIHDAGVIHQDLKSSNILVTPSGSIKIIDFGVARRFIDNPKAGHEIVGSPECIAPEIWKGQLARPESDLYALGVLFFELCLGHLPIEAELNEQFMYKHLTLSPPLLHKAKRSIPRWFSALTARLLQKNPDDRPSSAREVLEYIETRKPNNARRWIHRERSQADL